MKKYIIELSDPMEIYHCGISRYLLESILREHNLNVHSIRIVDDAEETYTHIKKGWLNNGDR